MPKVVRKRPRPNAANPPTTNTYKYPPPPPPPPPPKNNPYYEKFCADYWAKYTPGAPPPPADSESVAIARDRVSTAARVAPPAGEGERKEEGGPRGQPAGKNDDGFDRLVQELDDTGDGRGDDECEEGGKGDEGEEE